MRAFVRVSVATAPAMSAHCTSNFRPGYSGDSAGSRNTCCTASVQRTRSNPTGALTRPLGDVLNAASASSSPASCAAMRSAGDATASVPGNSHWRTRASVPRRPSHSARHAGMPASSADASRAPGVTRSRRTIARSNVLRAATCRALTCRSPSGVVVFASARGRSQATSSSTPSSTGTTATLAAMPNSSNVGVRLVMRAPAR